MFVRTRLVDYFLAALFVVTMGACSGSSGCSCGSSSPLPTGGLPGDQTIEGGAQVRVTPAGFNKLTSILPQTLNTALGGGICIPSGNAGGAAGASWCDTKEGGVCGTGNGCAVSLTPNNVSLSVTNAQQLQANIALTVDAPIHIDAIFGTIGCTLTINTQISGSVDFDLGIQGSNGELALSVGGVNSFSFGSNPVSGCSVLSDILNVISDFVSDLESSFLGPIINDLLTPLFNTLVQQILPSPLGIASDTDVGALLSGISPNTTALLETRLVPGGYATLEGGGMDLGVITGLNSDIDPTTRTGTRADGVPYASEPNLCVPPLPIPTYNLPTVARSAEINGAPYTLLAAGDFTSANDGASPPDIKMGISQTTLNLAGHHLVTSGAMCLDIGTQTISELNVGVISVLVPSLSGLEDTTGNDPLLLVTRPQRALTFTVGDNTMASPALTIGMSHFDVDFYAYLYERYVRVFTLDLTLNVGVLLDFTTTNGATTIQPMITGVDAADVTLTVLNSEFVKESPQQLEMVLPSVFNLVTPLLNNIPAINVPSFAGFSLSNLSIQKITTTQDTFLALFGDLGAGFGPTKGPQPASTGTARYVGVNTPSPAAVRSALMKQPNGALPQVTFDVDRYDGSGRELEWTWSYNDGLFHPWSSASPLVVSDPAFAWQGKYTIKLQSRVKGDYTTAGAITEYPVIIDSVGPRVMADQAQWNSDDKFIVPVWDVVSGDDVQVAFGRPGVDEPSTAWVYSGDAGLSQSTFQQVALNGQVQMFARDEAGNITIALVAPFHGTEGAQGCACNATGAPGSGSLVLIGLVGIVMLRSRRRLRISPRVLRVATWAGIVVAVSMAPSCSCNNHNQACEQTTDCTECPMGELPFCVDNMCVCNTDVPVGQLGPYSAVAVAPDGTAWVSAYHQTYGDLVVAHVDGAGRIADNAWTWVDGVPAGPVTVPGSQIRGGITDNGQDVGMYTSIAVASDGTPMVSYFDVDRGGLKLAYYTPPASAGSGSAAVLNAGWTITDVDVGNGSAGMFSSISLDPTTNKPGISYLAHVNGTAELRYALAGTEMPSGPSDWTTGVIDSGPIPDGSDDIYPLPDGLGLWSSSARNPKDQTPVVAYYDRGTGELKLATYSGTTWTTSVLDGGATGSGSAATSSDEGWMPSVAVDSSGAAHVSYASAAANQLRYVVQGQQPVTVDNGYRISGTSPDGLPQPTFDFVGANSGLVLIGGAPYIAYQDATTQELLLGSQLSNGSWQHTSIAGATQPWPGAYGFFASDALQASNIVMSNWVIDQPTSQNWVEVFVTNIANLQ
ncbi:MAG TPA: MYXO-CTERM sorting domain-containing protein [Kofleriaceae bacterium]|jgi:MYXO-CTERM domain-containing protein|nr:MYXO-CTERM sorting domain-containing protein [Kofleriaceae bacterium]